MSRREIVIEDPELWWPNGYGDQPLYNLKSELLHKGEILDGKEIKTGLRTMELDRTPDEWGESFGFRVNGITLFAMGGNIIPQDVFNTRADRETTEKLLRKLPGCQFQLHTRLGGRDLPRQ